tara:strand:- start:10839 stop:11057 length:219 start_codon:yes stop_codon:yes gene_type:complete
MVKDIKRNVKRYTRLHEAYSTHNYEWSNCGAKVCLECDDHKDLARCYCGWARDGGYGRSQLRDLGEQIEEDY